MSTQIENGSTKFSKEVSLLKPSDKIIDQISNLIRTAHLEAGDHLPPERKLADQFGVGRAQPRYAGYWISTNIQGVLAP
ncbi:MAG: GntR family transcriptional regulator [Bacteroidota bacterium]